MANSLSYAECMAFYNVGLPSSALEPTVKRFAEHMRKLRNDLRAILTQLPTLSVLHLCELGTHGHEVPVEVSDEISHVLGAGWTTMYTGNYAVFWKSQRVRVTDGPRLELVPESVRANRDAHPHSIQVYACEFLRPEGSSDRVSVFHVHHRSSTVHRWTDGARGRALAWLAKEVEACPSWVIGGDLNTGRYLVHQIGRAHV